MRAWNFVEEPKVPPTWLELPFIIFDSSIRVIFFLNLLELYI
jgi:hypothetical protein